LITSFYFGLVLFVVQFAFAPIALKLLCGEATQSLSFSIQYAKIRAFAAPVALPTIVAQAAFLTVKDSWTPLAAVLIGAAVNVVGDLVLINSYNLGIVGAAAATAASQFAGAFYLLVVALRKVRGAVNQDPLPSPSPSSSPSPSLSPPPHLRMWEILRKDFLQFPSLKDMRTYLAFCGPYFLILLVRTILWTFTFFACSSAGATELAAHQITINLFLFFCIFGEVTSQISQSYLPSFLSAFSLESVKVHATPPSPSSEEIPRRGRLSSRSEVEEMISKVVRLGLGIGAASGVGCLLLKQFGYEYITKSVEVLEKLSAVSGLLLMSTLPYALMLGLEGYGYRTFLPH
jgi:hypothetical protein